MSLVKIANKRQRMNRANNYSRIVEKLSEPAKAIEHEAAPIAAYIENKAVPIAEKVEKKVLSKIPKKYLIGAGSIAALAGAGYSIKKHYDNK